MASADAREASIRHGGVRCVFGDGKNRYYSEVFDNNPRVAKEPNFGETYAWVANYPSHRPYIEKTDKHRFHFREDFKASPGELYLTDHEKNKPSYVIIEPNVKEQFMMGRNKDWGYSNWMAVIEKLDLPWCQLGWEVKRLGTVRREPTKKFRSALGFLSKAKLLVTTDGALHHAAAALGIPAVVIWGGLASPKNLGYDAHTNLWHGDEPCGTHSDPCDHCRKALAKVTVEEVVKAVENALETV